MRKSTGPIALALACALTPGCTCSWFAPSAKGLRRVGSHEVTLKAQAHRNIGVDGWGIPHAPIGMVWPTIDGYGLSVQASVGQRPPIAVLAKATKALATEAELEGAMGEVELDASPDGNHLAYKVPAKGWSVLHLLPAGTPFDSSHSHAEGEKVDWSKLPTPEAIALAALRDEAGHYGTKYALLWEAVLAQPPGPPYDDALLGPFPEVKSARTWALERFDKKPAPSDAWREAAAGRAVAAIAAGKAQNKEIMEACVEVVVKADLPTRSDALDAALAREWSKTEKASGAREAFGALGRRLGICSLWPFQKSKGPPPSAAARSEMVASARGLFEQKRRRDEALEIVFAAGSDADRAWVDDALIAQWPDVERASADERQLHEQLAARAAGGSTSVCSQKAPPPGSEWRARLRDKARPLLSSERQGDDAACLLVSLGEQPGVDEGLDRWLEHLPTTTHGKMLVSRAKQGSPAWQERAKARAERARAFAEAKTKSGYAPDEERRLALASALLYRLEYDAADCERLAALRGKATFDKESPPDLPERCAKKK